MKMTEEHQKRLVELLDETVKFGDSEGLSFAKMFNMWASSPKVKVPLIATIWDYFRIAMRRNGYQLQDELYTYLNDSHIETILKRWGEQQPTSPPVVHKQQSTLCCNHP